MSVIIHGMDKPRTEKRNVGRWIEVTNQGYSPFGSSPETINICPFCSNESLRKTKFCPCCGAKMDGGENDGR